MLTRGFKEIVFRGKFMLFIIFLLVLIATVSWEVSVLSKVHEDAPPVFKVVEVEGSANVVDANGEISEVVEGEISFKPSDSLITYEDSSVVVEVNGENYVRLADSTVLRFDYLSFDVVGNNDAVKLGDARLYLESGKLWVNNVFNPVAYNIFTNRVLVLPDNGVLELDYTGSLLHVYNHQHDAHVGLLSKPYPELQRSGELADQFYNYFFLPEGNRIQIAEGKINAKLAKLLLSKLVKEFPMTHVVRDDLIKESWYEQNLTRDASYALTFTNNYVDSLSDTVVLKKLDELQRQYLLGVKRNVFPLIISEKKLSKEKQLFLSDLFSIGQKWNLDENNRDAAKIAESFYSAWDSSLQFLRFDSQYYLASELDELQGVLPTSVLYQGKKRLWDSSFSELKRLENTRDLLELLIYNLEEVYDLMDKGEFVKVLDNFDSWSSRVTLLLGSYNVDELKAYYPEVERIRNDVTNLFFRYSLFYTRDHFETLSYIDQKTLEFAPEQITQEESRQIMIQDRIKILKKLVELIKQDGIGQEDGVNLMDAMLANVKNLRNQALYRVAIYDYYDKEVENLDLVASYIKSPEYVLFQDDFDSGFAEFKERQADWDVLEGYIRQVDDRKDTVRRVNTEELIEEVYDQFVSRRIYPDKIAFLNDSQNRLFEINDAKINTVSFSARFDNQTKLLYEIEVEDQLLKKGVHIDRVKEVVNSIVVLNREAETEDVRTVSDASEAEVGESTYTSAELLGVKRAVKELKEFGFFVTTDDVDIIDLDNDTFYVREVALNGTDYTFSFEFDNIKDELSDVQAQGVFADSSGEVVEDLEKLYLDGSFFLKETLTTDLEVSVDAAIHAAGVKDAPKVQKKVKRG